MKRTCDVAVIGGGPGGYLAALEAARRGMSVILFEKGGLGGTCLNVGCIPTKYLLHKAGLIAEIRRDSAEGMFREAGCFSWKKIVAGKNALVNRMAGGVESLLAAAGVAVVRAEAVFHAPGTLHAGGEEYHPGDLIVATGSAGRVPESLRPAGLDSAAMLEVERIPRSLTVVGGGVVGLEFATMFSAAGARVTVVEMLETLLPGEDRETVAVLKSGLEGRGVGFRMGRQVLSAERGRAVLDDGEILAAEMLLCATGRRADPQGISGLELNPDGSIRVDARQRTSCEHVWAVGDVAGGPQLAHAAYAGAETAVRNIAGETCETDLEMLPRCIYSLPQFAAVGRTEEQLQAVGTAYRRGVFPLAASGRAAADGDAGGMVKVLSCAASGRILGVHAVGAQAGELIAPAVAAMNLGGTDRAVGGMIFPHPSLSEAFKEAALACEGRSLHAPGRKPTC